MFKAVPIGLLLIFLFVGIAWAGEQKRRDNELTTLLSLSCRDKQQEQTFRTFLDTTPAQTLKRAEILVLYAKCLLDTKRRAAEAVPLLKEAADILPNNAGIFRQLGLAYVRTGNDLEAIEAFEQSISLTPDPNHFTYYWLGFAHFRLVSGPLALSDPEAYKEGLTKSETYLRRAVSLSPDNPYYLSNLGDNLVIQGKQEEGIALIQQAIELTPQFKGWRSDADKAFMLADLYVLTGQAYWRSGRKAEGERMMKLGVEKAPNERSRKHLMLLGDMTMHRVPPSKRREEFQAWEDARQKAIFDPFEEELDVPCRL